MKNIINKTILFAAFAAGLSNISANAQYVSQAEARVYTSDIGMVSVRLSGPQGAIVDGDSAIDSIVADLSTTFRGHNSNAPSDAWESVWQFIDSDGTTNSANGISSNEYPSLNGTELAEGDLAVFIDHAIGVPSARSFELTVRIFTDGTDLFMAKGEGTVRPTPADPRTSDMLQVGEFWIDSNTNRQATELSSDLYGFVDAVCDTDNGYELQADKITCAPIPLTCGAGTAGGDFDNDGMCDCAFDAPVQETPETCRAAEDTQDCVNAGFMFFNPSAADTGFCSDDDPTPNCTDNATLNGDETACECLNSAFPILRNNENTFFCSAEDAMDCTEEKPFFDNNACVATCPDDRPLTESDGITCRPIAAADCGQNNMPDFYDGSMCVADCGDSFVNPANAGETCRPIAEVLATVSVSPTYTAESCERAGWISSITINSEKTEVAEVCGIPVVRNDSATVTVAAAAEFAPLQFPENVNANECIIRKSAGFDAAENMPDCDDENLFGDDGFPQMPADFNIATDRLIIVVVADGRNRIFFNDNEIRIAVAPPRNNDAEVAIIGAVGVAMAMYAIADFLHDGRPADAFAFSPEFGYRISENDYFIRAGGKIEYAVNEKLRMQWSAGQTNTGGDFGDFRYLSKAEYKADFWAATFSESVSGKTADYDFALSADLQNGIWKISPVYRMQSEWKESDSGIKTETQNELNLESEFRYNNWQIRPSAGFKWENFGNFTENGKLQMNAVYRF